MIDPHGLAPPSPAFDALSALVRDAKRGEVRLPPSSASRRDVPAAAAPAGSQQAPDAAGRLPSSWYRRTSADKPNLTLDMMRAAAMGLGTGLVLLLPLLWFGTSPPPPSAQLLDRTEAGLMLVAAQNDGVSLSTALLPADRMRALIELARVRMKVGDIASARTVLARADVARNAQALFLMAETYDPNVLGRWTSHNVTPDVDRARALYAAANALGHADADERLEALR